MNVAFKNLRYAICVSTLCATTFALTPAAFAHDVWLTVDKDGDQYVAQVNNGDIDKRELPDRNRIITLDIVTPTGMSVIARPFIPAEKSEQPVLQTEPFSAPSASVVAVTYDNGFWIVTPREKKELNSTKILVPDGSSPHWTVKFGKYLLGPGAWERVVNARGEFLPLKDPFKLAVGKKLPVRLVIDGKPIAGARVRYSDGVEAVEAEKVPFVKTDKEGVAEIPLSRKGSYLITADPNVQPLYPDLSGEDHVYVSLGFDLRQ